MKLPCEMIQDLLPLYHDGVCSQVSKTLVTEHLKDCPDCANAMQALKSELQMPKLETDEAKPLKSIKRRWQKKTWRKGILIGLAAFLLCFALWFELTQNCAVPLASEEYMVETLCQFSNGMYYLEYSIPGQNLSTCADVCRTDDGAIHFRHYRPRIVSRDPEKRTVKSFLIDPANNVLHTDSGKEVPLTSFWLGCPDHGDAILLWSADMEIPLATPEMETEHLYQFIFR